jgi:ABC-2 type transport system ATP-binding protein
MSGKENLEFIRKLNKISCKQMEKAIDFAGLSDRINDKVKKYSLGMKQRLALGICLLTDPKLLILDEPTNGLDPGGIIELRNMLTFLAKEKKVSILVSSHNLNEIEKICDKFIFIKGGKIISTEANRKVDQIQIFKIYIKDKTKGENLLGKCDFINKYTIKNNEFYISINKNKLSDLLKYLIGNEIEYDGIELIDSFIENEYTKMYTEDK